MKKCFNWEWVLQKSKFCHHTWEFNWLHQHDNIMLADHTSQITHPNTLSFKEVTWCQGDHKPKGKVSSDKMETLFLFFFWGGGLLLNEFYYIHNCTMITTTKFYSMSIPNPRCIPPPLNLSHLETVSFSESLSQYLFCKEVHCVFFLDSTCNSIDSICDSIWCWCLSILAW